MADQGIANTAEDRAEPWFLLLDDDRPLARIMARFIRGVTPCDVAYVHDISALLSQLETAPRLPAGVLLDFDLAGGETGVQAMEALRKAGFLVPCAFLTGAPDRVRGALRASKLGERPPVFSKGQEALKMASWVERLASAPSASSPFRGSGVRVKADSDAASGC